MRLMMQHTRTLRSFYPTQSGSFNPFIGINGLELGLGLELILYDLHILFENSGF